MAVPALPPDGMNSRLVSDDAEARLAQRLDDLHQMLYRRGGIRPANAAVEEIAKLLLLRLWLKDDPTASVNGQPLSSILNPDYLRKSDRLDAVKAAFTMAVAQRQFSALLPDGTAEQVWPSDEPFRLNRADVVAEALEVLEPVFATEMPTVGDPLGAAFDAFLRGRYDHSGGLGTYLTPSAVTSTLAEIALEMVDPLLPIAEGSVTFGDPCVGTGRFLIAMLDAARRRAEGEGSMRDYDAFRKHGMFGADQSAASVAKARTNLLLYGIRNPFVFTVRDSVTDRNVDALRGRLKLILTNPPFGDGKYDSLDGIARTRMLLPEVGKRDRIDPAIAFVARCLDLLAPGGVLGIVLPDGLVDGAVLRRALARQNLSLSADEISVEANISLPTAAFAPSGTVAKTSALMIRRGKPASGRILLARADHVGYIKQAGKVVPDPAGNDLPIITQVGCALLSGAMATPTVQPVVSEQPLVAFPERRDLATLDPSRLDPSSVRARHGLRAEGATDLSTLIKPVRTVRAKKVSGLPFVSVLHVDDLGAVAWHEAEVNEPSTPGQFAKAGDLLVSLLNPKKLRAAVVPDVYAEVECSAEFAVFEANVDPYAVLALLYRPAVQAQLAPLGRGTSSSRRRIEAADVLALLVPALDSETVERLGEDTRQSLEAIRVARMTLTDRFGLPATP
ncbi:MAG: HsdM family class I SAM-dependent methyltransferase [Mycobacteriales bacterium]